MKTLKIILLAALQTLLVKQAVGQDFLRIGAAHDFQKNKIVQTFSLDFNRTEKIDEKKGRYLLVSSADYYLLPTSDINLGDGVTSSENNVLAQLNAGKAFLGTISRSPKNSLVGNVWNKAIEFNPSYNSDRDFREKLTYGQLKFLLNFVSQRHNSATEPIFVQAVHSFAVGAFGNEGYRFSKTYDTGNFYSTAGVLLDYKSRLLNAKNEENWVFKVTGNYYCILSEVDQLTSDNFGGLIKSSIDRRVVKTAYLGVMHKYGNDNPNYAYVNTLEFSLKIKY
jgi:hypothetical protein